MGQTLSEPVVEKVCACARRDAALVPSGCHPPFSAFRLAPCPSAAYLRARVSADRSLT